MNCRPPILSTEHRTTITGLETHLFIWPVQGQSKVNSRTKDGPPDPLKKLAQRQLLEGIITKRETIWQVFEGRGGNKGSTMYLSVLIFSLISINFIREVSFPAFLEPS